MQAVADRTGRSGQPDSLRQQPSTTPDAPGAEVQGIRLLAERGGGSTALSTGLRAGRGAEAGTSWAVIQRLDELAQVLQAQLQGLSHSAQPTGCAPPWAAEPKRHRQSAGPCLQRPTNAEPDVQPHRAGSVRCLARGHR